MKLKNYTSGVPAERNMQNIETMLTQFGASHISKTINTDKKEVDGFYFQIFIGGIPMSFRLPVEVDAVQKLMEAEMRRLTEAGREKVKAQARRTAWALLRDWTHIQLSMVQMRQAETVQIFLPFICVPNSNQTFFERLKENGFKLLTEAK
jgi:hypothetical protein